MQFSGIDEGHVDGQDTMVFRYNRAERIARAPKIVQDYYAGTQNTAKRGLFKSLVATRANRFLFFSVILCAAAVMFMWYFGPRKDRNTLHHVPVSVTAFSFMDTVYTSVTFDTATAAYAETEPVPISVTFSFIDGDGQVVRTEKISGKYERTQQKLATNCTDYDIITVRSVVQVAEETIALSAQVERR